MSGTATVHGVASARGLSIVIVAARFHAEIVDALIAGATQLLVEYEADQVEVVRVPGAWEIPVVVDAVCARGGVDGVVALGCLLRGETLHFELLAEACTRGLEQATARHGVAIAHGVLACETQDQALARCAPGVANKGREAAAAAVETATILRQLRTAGRA